MDPPSDEGEFELPPTKIALRAARAGASDDDCEAVLRSVCGLTPTEARRRVERLGRRLEDARTAGQVAVLEALQDQAESGEGREQVTAAAQLLKHRADDTPPNLKRLMAKLREMDESDLKAHVARVLGGL